MGVGNIANSGMNSAMSEMEYIGNNIANADTPGFKRFSVNFSDISGGSGSGIQAPGLGVQVGNVSQDFSFGGVNTTGGALDFCLVPENAFFTIKDTSTGQTSYTRYGKFDFQNGQMIMGGQPNLQIMGYPAVNGVLQQTGNLAPIQISQNPQPAKASTAINVNLNLDANASIPSSGSFNMQASNTIFDSLGNPYPVKMDFSKTGANTWSVAVSVNGNSVGTGTVTFDSTGHLTSVTGLNALSFNPNSGAASPQALAIDLAGSTQFSGSSFINTNKADGYTTGIYNGYTVDPNGVVTVNYTNGSIVAGQIALAQFPSMEGLQSIGKMSWAATGSSGNAVYNPQANNGAFKSGVIETSNVNLTQEMMNLIQAQHAFQANAQVAQIYNQTLDVITKL